MRSIVRFYSDPPDDAWDGGIAQLGEHLLCTQRVSGSIPLTSTIEEKVLEEDGIESDDLVLCSSRLNAEKEDL